MVASRSVRVMAESTPLVHQHKEAKGEARSFDIPNSVSLDEAFQQCIENELGWIKLLQVVILSFAWAFDAQQLFISIFTDATPTWHCFDGGDILCNSSADICEISKGSWAWDMPYHVSIVSEWNLECSNSLLTALPTSSIFLGSSVGGIALSPLADSCLGRKKMLVISCLLMSVGAILAAFSTNVFMYSMFRFLSGFGRAPLTTSALVLAAEMVGKHRRGHVGLLAYTLFTVGFLSLPALAYLCRSCSWRVLYLLTSVPAILYALLAHLFVFESPRWLLLLGREDEARMIIEKFIHTELASAKWMSSMYAEDDSPIKNKPSAMKLLVSRTWVFHRLLIVMTIGFGLSMVYLGMPLGVGKLGFNLYLSVTLNALFELPASVITFFLLDHIQRKSAILVLMVLSGICSVGCTIVPGDMEWLKLFLELGSFLSACTAFDVFLIYVVELFPTCVRNSAVAMVRQAGNLGGTISPVVIAASVQGNSQLQYGVFGAGIALCGLSVIWLTETRGQSMSDTIEEQEYQEKS